MNEASGVDDAERRPAVLPSTARSSPGLAGSADLPTQDPERPAEAVTVAATDLDADAEFAAFYRAMIKPLVGFLVRQGASLPLAADIAQETMLSAHRRWADLRAPKAWVHTVASRELGRVLYGTKEEPVAELPAPTALLAHPDLASAWEAQDLALRVLAALPPRQRQVLAWTLAGFRPVEIAEQLELSAETVRGNLRKARLAAAAFLTAEERDQ
ncbi:RNA polymerase sigma factor [Streptomyces sp. NPDC090025]|uniref:RNA polymerase sigma factor n=1 Tax=Streptomyces sp. NPDC090025 TaxID=3365922 RepID=UPI003835DD2C